MSSTPRPADDPLLAHVLREQGTPADPSRRERDDAPRPERAPRLDAVRRALTPRGGRRAA